MQSGIRRCSNLISTDPQGLRGWRGVVRRPGTGGGKCHRCSSAHSSMAVCCKTPALAFWLGAQVEKHDFTAAGRGVHHHRHILYMLSVVPRDLDIQGGRARRFCGVLAPAESNKTKGREKTQRWEARQEEQWNITYCTSC